MGVAYHNTEKVFNPSQNIVCKLHTGIVKCNHIYHMEWSVYLVQTLKQPFSRAKDWEQSCYMSGKHFCEFPSDLH